VSRASRSLVRDLPWIGCEDPWAILVSEVMLQQTPAARVMGPWRQFLATYPTPGDLATAPLADVLTSWRGLGYHRRARDLQRAAAQIVERHAGAVPDDLGALRALAGVGEYTARAVASFAFGARVAVVDTNVGRVLARAVAGRPLSVREARDLADAMLGRRRSARFNQALIDLGARFCRPRARCADCPIATDCAWRARGGEDPSPSSAHVTRPQAPFGGSDRQWRGRVIERLREGPATTRQMRRHLADLDPARRRRVLAALVADGLVTRGTDGYDLGHGPRKVAP
jgi:A/G-specific adenine glycosylase